MGSLTGSVQSALQVEDGEGARGARAPLSRSNRQPLRFTRQGKNGKIGVNFELSADA